MTHQPCNNCPFRADKPFRGMRRDRAIELVDSLLNRDQFFQCHKTVDYSKSQSERQAQVEHPCIGAALFIDKLNAEQNGVFSNWSFAYCESMGHLKYRDIDQDFPVCDSVDEFVEKASS